MAYLPGFSKIAKISNEGDKRIIDFSSNPSIVKANDAFLLIWQTDSVPKIRIYGGSFDTGIITNSGTGQVQVSTGITTTTLFTIQGYDSFNNILSVNSIPVQKSIYVVVN